MSGQMIAFPGNGGTADGYLAKPAAVKAPGVVVIQEWWGLNEQIKGIADRLASAGYLALVPDLFHGKKTSEPDEAQKLMMAMKMDVAAKDLAGAFDFLKASDACTGKVGSVGFCLGGGLSLFLATIRPVDACVVFYGVLPGAQPNLNAIAGPVLGHYAEDDGWASPDAARALEQQLKDAGKQVEFHIYAHAKHAFMNDTPDPPKAGGGYSAEASALAWERTLAFYAKHLA